MTDNTPWNDGSEADRMANRARREAIVGLSDAVAAVREREQKEARNRMIAGAVSLLVAVVAAILIF